MSMLCLLGSPTLSSFRTENLLDQLMAEYPLISDISVESVYFVHLDANASWSSENQHTLEDLLGASIMTDEEGDATFVVTPRAGTVSPWSSKATEICHAAGLNTLQRVEHGRRICLWRGNTLLSIEKLPEVVPQMLHDRMVESVITDIDAAAQLFHQGAPEPLNTVPVLAEGAKAIEAADKQLGLALSADEVSYLVENFTALNRDPSDAELMMFAQANSEHCRHKIFNASWTLDGTPQERSLFGMIRNTADVTNKGLLSAYHDNAAVIEGYSARRWLPTADGGYAATEEPTHIQIKVETHNHPTAISPFPGAATGAGGEIRDEGATGNGSKPKAGLCGFTVSNLELPDWRQPWEKKIGKPDRIASALDIMVEGPIGAAAFNNEFGRPNLTGYFRTYCQPMSNTIRGYHKPVMIAGGYGNIRPGNVNKQPIVEGAALVVLGGPSMKIGLGGGAASSMASGSSDAELDFASVQRGNPEMQRRCQEVIDRCIALGDDSPILSMHDVGAGGISNALPELINDAGMGGIIELRNVLNDEPAMSPLALWCNESQERYVLAIANDKLEQFEALCGRENCLYAVVGHATTEQNLVVTDSQFDNRPVDLPLSVLLGKPPKLAIDATHKKSETIALNSAKLDVHDCVDRVLQLPSVAAKNFLITIGDRSVTGQVVRDQLVGPWQMPVADAAVTAADYEGFTGEAMSMGERSPVAVIDAAASAKLAIGEAITNLGCVHVGDLSNVKLSANWMAAAGNRPDDADLYDAVHAVGMELAPALGIAIPVGKDSLSMRTQWQESSKNKEVMAPVTVVITAFSAVEDVRRVVTPQLRTDCGETELLLIDLGMGQNRLGGSALAQVHNATGNIAPTVDDPALLKGFHQALQTLHEKNHLLAYHDRSDGGLMVTLAEMAFAGNVGINVQLQSLSSDLVAALFNEELGAVIQIRQSQYAEVMAVLEHAGIGDAVHTVGSLNATNTLHIQHGSNWVMTEPVNELRKAWWQTSYHIQKQRDNPDCAEQELQLVASADDPGITPVLSFDPQHSVLDAPGIVSTKPKVAILREQGVNSHVEMAASFAAAGFEPLDVHMNDLISGAANLSDVKGLAVCGGFSYGDVLGAGGGWAKRILYTPKLFDAFSEFFHRNDTFSLGVCNGCQMMSQIKSLIPGADLWPRFERNLSEQYEARLSLVEIFESPSVLLTDMAGSRIPVAVAHGEGRVQFANESDIDEVEVSVGFVDNHGQLTEQYPLNPNGSPHGVTGFCSDDGRATILMPHPERVARTVTHSWHPPEWGDRGPWMRLFDNARVYVG